MHTAFRSPISLATPPWTRLGKLMESQCRRALLEFDLLENKRDIGLALSGGKDSLTLLFLLAAIQGKGLPPFNLHGFHVSGAFSCGPSIQTNYLKKVCDAMNIPLHISYVEKTPTACYPCSRKRRSLLFSMAKKCNIDTLAFGHHQDDSNQTLLLNLFQKGEFAANLPKVHMQKYKITIVRPLIYISEQSIIAFAKLHQFLRITCQCPIGQTSYRKKVATLIDQAEILFPHLKKNLSRASKKYGDNKALYP